MYCTRQDLELLMKSFITWLFVKYVYIPDQKARAKDISDHPRDYVVTFEPSPEWEAQVEKNCTKPKSH